MASSATRNSSDRKTTVLILGAGVSGIAAARALAKQSITNFIIVDRNNYVGGRMRSVPFGKKPDGTPWTVELGANWVQDPHIRKGEENPVWTFAKKHGLKTSSWDFLKNKAYTKGGPTDIEGVVEEYTKASETAGDIALDTLEAGGPDMNMRAALGACGWRPDTGDAKAALVEWMHVDWEGGFPPEQTSSLDYYSGFAHHEEDGESDFGNRLVHDQRGFGAWLKCEASEFLDKDDPRLMLETVVESVSYGDEGAKATLADGSSISADYAICTFSIGVLQHDMVTFDPPFPDWKRSAIHAFTIGTYTKLFLQFPDDISSWGPSDSDLVLYADPLERGRFPAWQSLNNILPGSNIVFTTVTTPLCYKIEAQSDAEILVEVMSVLRSIFPNKDVPDPCAFTYPRWSLDPSTRGSYSNWPPAFTTREHQNLCDKLGRLYFAGEACSAEYISFLHGAWYTGEEVGKSIAKVLKENEKCVY